MFASLFSAARALVERYMTDSEHTKKERLLVSINHVL
jgi:hypothetical protein